MSMQEARVVTAANVMAAPVVTVPESGTLWDAWSIVMNCHVHHAVVVSGRLCVGVIDDRAMRDAWQKGPAALSATPIRDLLHDRTSCVLPETALSEVAALMNIERVDAVPVVDPHGSLLGLITAGDVIYAVARYGLCTHSELVSSEAGHSS